MKLQFLVENTPDFSYFKQNLSSETFAKLIVTIDQLTKGLKFVRAALDDSNKLAYTFNNSLIEMSIVAHIGSLSSKELSDRYPMLTVNVKVVSSLMIKNESEADRVLMDFLMFLNHENHEKQTIEGCQQTINDFVEWYFEMSAEYGKVKLIQVMGNTVEGYSRNGEHRFVAIAGDFSADRDPADSSKRETQMKVY